MKYILDKNSPPDLLRFGGKAAALAHLSQTDLPIPPWFVVDPAAFYVSLPQKTIEELERCCSAEAIQRLLETLELTTFLAEELKTALASLAPRGERVAVRSSAVDEDGAEHSFAGQLESYLYIPPEQVPNRLLDVWRSGFSERVLSYRAEAGLSWLPPAPAVLVQRMVDSETAGVAFAADPVSGKRNIAVISAVHGLGTALVSGDVDADLWHVDSNGEIVKRHIAHKEISHRFSACEGNYLRTEAVASDLKKTPSLPDSDVVRVAALVRKASRYFGKPQDIEWAIEKNSLYLLQSRPITALRGVPDPDGEYNLWDNSNIAESYGGVTTPLTFSFARRAYESVYREFCRILKVPKSAIQDNDTVFQRMLGLIDGRVYYNLLSWYRVLALLPGFAVNRKFMEQMMGVKEGLPPDLALALDKAGAAERLKDAARFAGTLFGLVANHFTLPRKIDRFYVRLEEALAEGEVLGSMRMSELCAHYHDLEKRLLTRWDAPLINDFFAMIFYGLLRKLSDGWCTGIENFQNDLLAGEGGMISAEPAQRVRLMAGLIGDDREFVTLLVSGDLREIEAAMRQRKEFSSSYADYLAKFGDRCLDELKLESKTLHDEPLLLLRSIGQMARHRDQRAASLSGTIDVTLRAKAEVRVSEALHMRPLKRVIYHWVLKHARARVRDRENLRFERTRLFGRVRRIFIELGARFFAEGLLEDPRDVFYLQVEEVMGFVEGTTVTTDLRGLVALRKKEFARYEAMEAPSDRFETFGAVHVGNRFRVADTVVPDAEGDLKGIGCCPGVVRGPVRIVRDPRNVTLLAGEILVAERTDPGWIMLFPASAGILVERGSLLSHSAIVAREMGIPAIVSIPGVTRILNDGDWVEFDGSSGAIRRVAEQGVADGK